MTSIIADAHLQAALGGCAEPVEIRDPSGKLLGHFTPAPSKDKRAYDYIRSIADPNEWQRRKSSNDPGISTSELLAKLNSMESR